MNRESTGQLMSQGQADVILRGDVAVVELFDEYVSQNSYEAFARLLGAFPVARHIDSTTLQRTEALIRHDGLKVDVREDLTHIVLEPVLFREDSYYNALKSIADYVLHDRHLHNKHSNAQSVLNWLDRRHMAVEWHRHGRLSVHECDLMRISQRPEFRTLGFSTSDHKQLLEAILNSIDFHFDSTLSSYQEIKYYPEAVMAEYDSIPNAEVYFSHHGLEFHAPNRGSFAAIVGVWRGACEFDGSLKILDARVAYSFSTATVP